MYSALLGIFLLIHGFYRFFQVWPSMIERKAMLKMASPVIKEKHAETGIGRLYYAIYLLPPVAYDAMK